jgi:hypothetical protein
LQSLDGAAVRRWAATCCDVLAAHRDESRDPLVAAGELVARMLSVRGKLATVLLAATPRTASATC